LTGLASSALNRLASETDTDRINRFEEESKMKDAEMQKLRQAMDDIAKREETWRNKAKRLEENKKDQSVIQSQNMAASFVKAEDPDLNLQALSPRGTIGIEVVANTLKAIRTALESLLDDFDETTSIIIPEAAVDNELELLIQTMFQQGPNVDAFE
jgi:hypothetical protein